jgi:hypothetical protein
MTGPSMNDLIRKAAFGGSWPRPAPTPDEPDEPFGVIGGGQGGGARPWPRVEENVNEAIRRQWKVITGRVDLDAIGNW